MAQWIRHRPTEPGIAGSSPAGVICNICWQRWRMNCRQFRQRGRTNCCGASFACLRDRGRRAGLRAWDRWSKGGNTRHPCLFQRGMGAVLPGPMCPHTSFCNRPSSVAKIRWACLIPPAWTIGSCRRKAVAAVAQLAARRSHNPKVVSSILTCRICTRAVGFLLATACHPAAAIA